MPGSPVMSISPEQNHLPQHGKTEVSVTMPLLPKEQQHILCQQTPPPSNHQPPLPPGPPPDLSTPMKSQEADETRPLPPTVPSALPFIPPLPPGRPPSDPPPLPPLPPEPSHSAPSTLPPLPAGPPPSDPPPLPPGPPTFFTYLTPLPISSPGRHSLQMLSFAPPTPLPPQVPFYAFPPPHPPLVKFPEFFVPDPSQGQGYGAPFTVVDPPSWDRNISHTFQTNPTEGLWNAYTGEMPTENMCSEVESQVHDQQVYDYQLDNQEQPDDIGQSDSLPPEKCRDEFKEYYKVMGNSRRMRRLWKKLEHYKRADFTRKAKKELLPPNSERVRELGRKYAPINANSYIKVRTTEYVVRYSYFESEQLKQKIKDYYQNVIFAKYKKTVIKGMQLSGLREWEVRDLLQEGSTDTLGTVGTSDSSVVGARGHTEPIDKQSASYEVRPIKCEVDDVYWEVPSPDNLEDFHQENKNVTSRNFQSTSLEEELDFS